jgi:hypothetical protein
MQLIGYWMTPENIKRSIGEARNQTPYYTQTLKDSQEYIVQCTREMADNYIELQRNIIISLQTALS